MVASLRKSEGGRQLQQKIHPFKKSTYGLKLSCTSCKRKAEEELVFEKENFSKLEKEMQLVKAGNENLHKLTHHFARKLVKKAGSHVNLKRSRTGKKSNQYSRAHQYCMQKARVTVCKNALSFLAADGSTPLSIKVKTLEGERGNIALKKDPPLEKTKNVAENLNSVLYIKDHFAISHAAYHGVTIVCKNLPSRHQLQSSINQLNSSYNINPIPGDKIGFQQSICHMLDMALKCHAAEEFTIPEKIRIKLSGDGAWLGKRIHVPSFTFTLPDFPDAVSAYGNNLIAIFHGSESYDQVKQSISDIVEEAKILQTFAFFRQNSLSQVLLKLELKIPYHSVLN